MLTPLKYPDVVAFPCVTLPLADVTFWGAVVVFVFEYSFAIAIRESPETSPTEYKQTAAKKREGLGERKENNRKAKQTRPSNIVMNVSSRGVEKREKMKTSGGRGKKKLTNIDKPHKDSTD